MPRFEYKVVPAPAKGQKAKGVKTPEGRFALGVEAVLNQMGAEGWEYLRAELLPSDERSGLTGSTVHWRNVLVFRRALEKAATRPAATTPAEPPVASPAPAVEPAPEPTPEPPVYEGAARMLKDNGVEELSDVAGMTTALKTRAQQHGQSEDSDASETTDTKDETGNDAMDEAETGEVIQADFDRKDPS